MKNKSGWFFTVVFFAFIILSLSSCTCFALVKGRSSGTEETIEAFCIGVWILSAISLVAYWLGITDDSVGGHHYKDVQVDNGKWHTIHTYNPEEARRIHGSGTEERGNRWADNIVLWGGILSLFFVQFDLLRSWVGSTKNIVYVIIVGAIIFELFCLFDFFKRNITSIRYLMYGFCAIDLVIGGVINVFRWLFS